MDAATSPDREPITPVPGAAVGSTTSGRILISAGEASGDAYGASLVRQIRLITSGLSISAGGGAKLKAELGEVIVDSREWGAVSITQSIKVAPKVIYAFYRLKAELKDGRPGLFIPIDFGFMNVRLMRFARKKGWKILTFVPPGSWRRDRQGKEVAALSDAISTPFPWSADLLRQAGAKEVHWFGHPIKQLLKEGLAGVPDERRPQIALLPGSRRHEIDLNLPTMAALMQPEVAAEFGLAPNLATRPILGEWRHLTGRDDPATTGNTALVLHRSRAALVCSGTATLEAALCRTPMIVIYAASKAMLLEARIVGFKRPEFIALPNILLQRRVVPEFIMGSDAGATIEALRAELDAILASPEKQLADFEELDAMLGPDDAITQTAQLALRVMG